jgi:hypothetical protein
MTSIQRPPLHVVPVAACARNPQKSLQNLGHLKVLVCTDNNSALLKTCSERVAKELSKLAAHRMCRYQM